MWTCCSCEKQIDERMFDLDERMCFDCIEEDWELYLDERDKEESEAYRERTEVVIEGDD